MLLNSSNRPPVSVLFFIIYGFVKGAVLIAPYLSGLADPKKDQLKLRPLTSPENSDKKRKQGGKTKENEMNAEQLKQVKLALEAAQIAVRHANDASDYLTDVINAIFKALGKDKSGNEKPP